MDFVRLAQGRVCCWEPVYAVVKYRVSQKAGIAGPAEWMLASQKGSCSVELFPSWCAVLSHFWIHKLLTLKRRFLTTLHIDYKLHAIYKESVCGINLHEVRLYQLC